MALWSGWLAADTAEGTQHRAHGNSHGALSRKRPSPSPRSRQFDPFRAGHLGFRARIRGSVRHVASPRMAGGGDRGRAEVFLEPEPGAVCLTFGSVPGYLLHPIISISILYLSRSLTPPLPLAFQNETSWDRPAAPVAAAPAAPAPAPSGGGGGDLLSQIQVRFKPPSCSSVCQV